MLVGGVGCEPGSLVGMSQDEPQNVATGQATVQATAPAAVQAAPGERIPAADLAQDPRAGVDVDQLIASAPLSLEEVARRRAAGQGNVVVRRTGRTVRQIIRANVVTRINAMLAVLFGLVLITGKWVNSAFALLIVANSAIGIIQELRAKRTLDKLTIVNEAQVTVLRTVDGVVTAQTIRQEELVVGDHIALSAGQQIVVDGVVIAADQCDVDESALTGESLAIHKYPGDAVMSGSFVTAGSSTMVATVVGENCFQAKLIAEAGEFSLTSSQIQQGINKILKVITWLLIPVGLLTIWVQLYRTGEPFNASLLAMVAALVPMIPEGLVLMTSIAFAVGVVRLGKMKALVNELPAIEGLARVSVVCTDKTGTLTENRMVLRELIPVSGAERELSAAVAAIAAADEHPNDTMAAIGAGLGSGVGAGGSGVGAGSGASGSWGLVASLPFDSARKFSCWDFGGAGCYCIGAPDVLNPADDSATVLMRDGLRVLAVGRIPALPEASEVSVARPPAGFTPLGLVVLEQKLRDDAAATIAFFQREGVAVKVISGDNPISVGAVARGVGIDSPPIDARALPTEWSEFKEAVVAGEVFGRVTPTQKRDMVVALKEAGHQVAMTGDGVNDVLALKQADIGVAMGAGSPASRAVAQLVLLGNNFSAMSQAVGEGRRVIGNIERVANLFLTKTCYSAMLALIVGLFGVVFPFEPIHVTVAGWFTIGIPAFILSLAPNHERAKPGFASRVLRQAVPSGLIIGTVTVAFWLLIGIHHPGSGPTTTLICMLLMGVWVLTLVARPWNLWKLILVGGCIASYCVLFSLPIAQQYLILPPPGVHLLLQALGFGLVGMVAIEVAWLVARRKAGEKEQGLV